MSQSDETESPALYEQAQTRLRENLAKERARSTQPAAAHGVVERFTPVLSSIQGNEASLKFYQEALQALEDDAMDLAEDALRRSLSRYSEDPAPWRELMLLLLEQKRFADAQRASEELLSIVKNDPDGFRVRALCLDRLEREEDAFVAWLEFLERCPPTWVAARRQAENRCHKLKEQPQSVGKSGFVGSKISRCHPPREEGPRGEANVSYQEALQALAAGDSAQAETALRRTIARDKRDPNAWRELAILLVENNRFDEAREPLERAISLDPDDFELHRFDAISHERLGEAERAILSYQRFLKGCPDDQHQRLRIHAEKRIEGLIRGDVEMAPSMIDHGEVEELPPVKYKPLLLLVGLLLAWSFGSYLTDPGPVPTAQDRREPHVVLKEFRKLSLLALAQTKPEKLFDLVVPPLQELDEIAVTEEFSSQILSLDSPRAVAAVSQLLGHPHPGFVRVGVQALIQEGSDAAYESLMLFVINSYNYRFREPVNLAITALLEYDGREIAAGFVRALALASRGGRGATFPWELSHTQTILKAIDALRPEEVADAATEVLERLRQGRKQGVADRRVRKVMRAIGGVDPTESAPDAKDGLSAH